MSGRTVERSCRSSNDHRRLEWPLIAINSHPSTRQREQRRPRFQSAGHAPGVLPASGPSVSPCRPRRPRRPARASRHDMRRRFQTWQDITGTTMAVEGRREGSPSHPWGR
jgi:hypothetical protein